MYMRNYCQDREEEILVPENYDGNAFRTNAANESPPSFFEQNKIDLSADESNKKVDEAKDTMSYAKNERSFLGALKSFIPEGLFSRNGFLKNALLDIGTEEILIIGIALFLFFSKDCDKECALILIFLLFVK